MKNSLTSPDTVFEQKPTKKVETTMFEINDTADKKEFEFGRHAGSSYVKPFIEFIESLGYELGEPSLYTSQVEFNGITFHIDTNHASYKSKSAWTRKIEVRKPENRFIVMSTFDASKHKLKIHFNKEYDAQKLRNKIDAAIKEINDRKQSREDHEKRENDNVIAVAMHYLNNVAIKKNIDQVYIHLGVITFYLKNQTGSIEVNAIDNSLKAANFDSVEMKTVNEIIEFTNTVQTKARVIEAIADAILSVDSISPELGEWATKRYHGHFYVKTMSTEWRTEKNEKE